METGDVSPLFAQVSHSCVKRTQYIVTNSSNKMKCMFVKWTCKLPVIFWTFDTWQCFSRAFNWGALFSYNYMKVAQSHSQQHVWNIHWANCRTIALCTLTSSQEMFFPHHCVSTVTYSLVSNLSSSSQFVVVIGLISKWSWWERGWP